MARYQLRGTTGEDTAPYMEICLNITTQLKAFATVCQHIFLDYWRDKCWEGPFGAPNPALYQRPPRPWSYASLPSDQEDMVPGKGAPSQPYMISAAILCNTPGECPECERDPLQPSRPSRYSEWDTERQLFRR